MVPNGWKCSPLKSLIDSNRKITYGVLKPDTPEGSSCALMIRSSDYTYGWISNDEIMPISCQLDKEYKRSRVSTGDILLTVVGANIGTVATVPERLDGSNISRAVARISVDETKAHTAFVTCFLKSSEVQKFIYSSAVGGAQPVINLKELGLFKVPLPPLPEQKKIARILSTWDRAIETVDKLIENSKQQKKALMQQLLTGKKRLPGFSRRWEKVKLGKIISLINGRGFKATEWSESGLPIIRIQNLNGEQVFNYYSGEYDNSILIQKGDLLFAWSGSRGTSFGPCIWQGVQGLLNQHIWKIHITDDACIYDYLRHYLDLLTVKIEDKAHGAGNLVHITKKEIINLSIPLPEKNEQQWICDYLSSADRSILKYQSLKANCVSQKQALMQQLLTGKRRVKVDDDRSLAQAG